MTHAPILLLARGTQGTTLATNSVVSLSASDGWSSQLHPGRVAIDVRLLRGPCDGTRDPLARLRLPTWPARC